MEMADSVASLITRIRRGDEEAAAILVREYEPELRREIRLRLRGARLQSVLDSMDICQSVLGSFFARTYLGRYRLETPRDVLKLLIRMARNKVVSQCRKQYAARRDAGRTESLRSESFVSTSEPRDKELPPAEFVAMRELVKTARGRLTPRERRLAELRIAGCSWQEIAQRMGGTANGQSRQLSRAAARIIEELDLVES